MLDEIDRLMDELVAQQRAKLLALARALNPRLTGDDLLSPNDFEELAADPRFNYEDGLLAGLLSAQIAVRARLKSRAS
ncbi:MAG TPA: hypothetical protein VFG76_00355 [Candidatus Polarisedimenticolia bacterium]|nr:hypothetical protein [Candidatus Polarisedimenticolia bacterium]